MDDVVRDTVPGYDPWAQPLPTPQWVPARSDVYDPWTPPWYDVQVKVPGRVPGAVLDRFPGVTQAPLLGNPFLLPRDARGRIRLPRRSTRQQPQRRQQPRARERAELRELDPRRNLTPSQNPALGLQPGRVELPEQAANPCTVAARDAKRRQRRRRKECTKWVTKEIRVCQSSNAK